MKKNVLFSIGILTLSLSPVAYAQTANLFTTFDDFSQWTANGGDSVTPDNGFSADGATTINGAGNTTAAGGTGTSGSLSIQWTPSIGSFSFDIANAPNEAANAAFQAAIDPGSTGGNAVNYAGNLYMDYSLPDNEGGSYFQLGMLLQYQGDGYFGFFFSSTATDLGFQDPNGEEVFQATIPYTITGGAPFNGFGFAIAYNSDFSPALPFHIDDIFVPVPEPSTFALIGLGLGGLAVLRRKRKA